MSKHILIVDDETPLLLAFQRLLSLPGIMVHMAESKDEAVRLLETFDFDVVITDLRLGGSGNTEGFEIIESLRRREKAPQTIVVTADDSVEVVERARQLGVAFLFEKPISAQTLRGALAALGV
ncbi:MAG: hypothetical protein Kow0059_10490 [Candidatus Sumerlaeia bacterium]